MWGKGKGKGFAANFRLSDWDCPKCRNVNWAKRERCNRCNESRPAGVGDPHGTLKRSREMSDGFIEHPFKRQFTGGIRCHNCMDPFRHQYALANGLRGPRGGFLRSQPGPDPTRQPLPPRDHPNCYNTVGCMASEQVASRDYIGAENRGSGKPPLGKANPRV